MKGLIAQNMQTEPETEEQALTEEPVGAQGEPAEQTGEGEASDEDIERVVIAAQHVLYDEQTHDSIMKTLQTSAKDPAQAIANVTTNIVTQLDEQAGNEIPGDAILPAAAHIIPLVAELGEKAGLFKADEQVQSKAMGQVFADLGEHYGVSEEDMAEIQQILSEEQGAQPQGETA